MVVCILHVYLKEGPLTQGDIWVQSSFLELRPFLSLLTAHSLLRDASNKGYQVQNHAEFYVLSNSQTQSLSCFGGLLLVAQTQKEKTCAVMTSTTEGHSIEI